MENSKSKAPQTISVQISDEDGGQTIDCCPLLITDFKMAEGGDNIVVGIPEELHGIEVAVVLVTKPIS